MLCHWRIFFKSVLSIDGYSYNLTPRSRSRNLSVVRRHFLYLTYNLWRLTVRRLCIKYPRISWVIGWWWREEDVEIFKDDVNGFSSISNICFMATTVHGRRIFWQAFGIYPWATDARRASKFVEFNLQIVNFLLFSSLKFIFSLFYPFKCDYIVRKYLNVSNSQMQFSLKKHSTALQTRWRCRTTKCWFKQ